ncbi:DUF4124 domain-containing protein [Noviherbaspirillum humi]|nr:DUF4124 domain-containing protein [Noviherbaspirillum humi]
MKSKLLIVFLLAAASSAAWAQTEIFQCVSADGAVEFRNTGPQRGCKRMDLPAQNVIPAPKRIVAQAAAAKPAASASPAGFPKVDGDTQKARDSDRRQILQDELKAEERKLAELKKEFNNGEPERRGDERNYAKYQERVAGMKEDINRTEKNVEALQREIGNLK